MKPGTYNRHRMLPASKLRKLRKEAMEKAKAGHVAPATLAAGPTPPTKLSRLAAAYAAGDFKTAIGIAARFPQLGAERDAILEAHGAYTNPRFCQQLGKDPETLKAAGIAALAHKYSLEK